MSSIGEIAAWVVGISAAIAVLVKFFNVSRKLFAFLDEVTGEPAAFGRAAKPGLVEKVDQIQTEQANHTVLIERALHELFPNSGGSLRDVVDRLEKQSTPSVNVHVTPPSEH
jgi:hypothetical protein